nr:DeoR family transcriptional regulator [Desulfuromonadales bacterium]
MHAVFFKEKQAQNNKIADLVLEYSVFCGLLRILIAMLAAERQNEIVKLVRSEGSVRTRDLARALACAEETIRRDL